MTVILSKLTSLRVGFFSENQPFRFEKRAVILAADSCLFCDYGDLFCKNKWLFVTKAFCFIEKWFPLVLYHRSTDRSIISPSVS